MAKSSPHEHDPNRGEATALQVLEWLRAKHDPHQVYLCCQQETWERVTHILESIYTDQAEIRAAAFTTLVEMLGEKDDRKLALSAAKEVLAAADRRAQLAMRYDDLSDPDTYRAALAEFRAPSRSMQRLIADAWERPTPKVVDTVLQVLDSDEWRGILHARMGLRRE